MIIVFCAAGIDQARLDALLDQHDRAVGDAKDQIAEEIYALVGGQIRGMVMRANRTGRPLSPEQLDALAWQALHRGMNESGMTTLKRNSADWDSLIARVREGRGPVERRIWSLLSDGLRKALVERAAYVPQALIDEFARELNALLRRRDLLDPALFTGMKLDQERAQLLPRMATLPTTEITRLNAVLLASAMPEIRDVPAQERNLMGYIAKGVIPRMRTNEIGEAATGKKADPEMVRVWNVMKPYMQQLDEMWQTGKLPPELASKPQAERVYALYRESLDTARKWYEAQATRILARPYSIRNHADLQHAVALLREHGVPESSWPKIPPSMAKPFGWQVVQSTLDEMGREQALEAAPASRAQSALDLTWQTPQNQQTRAYVLVVDMLFAAPNQDVERAVGHFLATNPKPAGAAIEQFLMAVPQQVGEVLEDADGTRRVMKEVDLAVRDAIKDSDMQQFLMSQLGVQQATAAIGAVRRIIYCRLSHLFLRRTG